MYFVGLPLFTPLTNSLRSILCPLTHIHIRDWFSYYITLLLWYGIYAMWSMSLRHLFRTKSIQKRIIIWLIGKFVYTTCLLVYNILLGLRVYFFFVDNSTIWLVLTLFQKPDTKTILGCLFVYINPFLKCLVRDLTKHCFYNIVLLYWWLERQ